MKHYTDAGVELTEEQSKLVDSFKRLMKKWDKNLCINAIAGNLHIMLLGDTDQNPVPEMSSTQGFNPENIIISFNAGEPYADGGRLVKIKIYGSSGYRWTK